MLCNWFLPRKTFSEKSKRKRLFDDQVMEKKEAPMIFFARVDKSVGVFVILGVYLSVEDVNLKIVKVLTADYGLEQRTILYRDNITRAEREAIVRQRYTIMSRNTSTKDRIVGQALVANKPGRRNRKQHGSGKGAAGKGVSADVAVAKNDNNSSTKDGEREFDDKRCVEWSRSSSERGGHGARPHYSSCPRTTITSMFPNHKQKNSNSIIPRNIPFPIPKEVSS